jgi:hypothetical protein
MASGSESRQSNPHTTTHDTLIYILVFVAGVHLSSIVSPLCSPTSTRSSASHMPGPLSCKETRACCQAMSPLDQKADSPVRTRPSRYTSLHWLSLGLGQPPPPYEGVDSVHHKGNPDAHPYAPLTHALASRYCWVNPPPHHRCIQLSPWGSSPCRAQTQQVTLRALNLAPLNLMISNHRQTD